MSTQVEDIFIDTYKAIKSVVEYNFGKSIVDIEDALISKGFEVVDRSDIQPYVTLLKDNCTFTIVGGRFCVYLLDDGEYCDDKTGNVIEYKILQIRENEYRLLKKNNN